jgi:hypothetical protein
MKTKRGKIRGIFWAACLSLPLCLVSVLMLTPDFLFQGTFIVTNQAGETLYITPIFEAYGRSFTTVQAFSQPPYLPIFQRAALRLKPGQSLRIYCEIDEDYTFSALAVRNVSGDYREWRVPSNVLLGPVVPEPSFTIPPFQELPAISASALEVARQAERPNSRALGAIGLGLVPLGLFALWNYLKRGRGPREV